MGADSLRVRLASIALAKPVAERTARKYGSRRFHKANDGLNVTPRLVSRPMK